MIQSGTVFKAMEKIKCGLLFNICLTVVKLVFFSIVMTHLAAILLYLGDKNKSNWVKDELVNLAMIWGNKTDEICQLR